jgi:flavin-dependent dehydrogenase
MNTDAGRPYDVVVIGGGPAGAVVSRLLARWGHRVLLLCRSESRPPLAESLPPSTAKLLARAEVLEAVEAAGFYRSRGNTVRWESDRLRQEPFPNGLLGYQVLRPEFDRLLIGLAADAGVSVRHDAPVLRVRVDGRPGAPSSVELQTSNGVSHISAPWVLDCTGRSGVVARALHLRRAEQSHRTLALVCPYRRDTGWDLPDPTHTLVESYRDGWAWSVPVSPSRRFVAVMVDPREGITALAPRREAEAMFQAEVQKTTHLRDLVRRASCDGPVAAHDASLYAADRASGTGFLLVGDAYSFIDPLSSMGVKKALASGWLAAVVVHTALANPSLQAVALDLFESREREVYESYRRLAAGQFGHALGRHNHRFWTDRATLPGLDEPDPMSNSAWEDAPRSVRRALDELKQSPAIHLARTTRWQTAPRAAVQEREVVLEERLLTPRHPHGVRFLHGVDLVSLGAMAGSHAQVPDLCDAYNRAHVPVGLPEFLAALATLLAEGLLENRV